MRNLRRPAIQTHYTPSIAHRPSNGALEIEVESEPVKTIDFQAEAEPFPYGATAQNEMRGVVLLQCSLCGGLEEEEDVESHVCQPKEVPYGEQP